LDRAHKIVAQISNTKLGFIVGSAFKELFKRSGIAATTLRRVRPGSKVVVFLFPSHEELTGAGGLY
jgi:hypothetical protein